MLKVDTNNLSEKLLPASKFKIKDFIIAFLGCLIFAVAVNMIITPMNLYNGGMMGLAQIIRTLLMDYAGLKIPSNIDIAGIIYYIMNIPVLYIAYTKFSREFFIRTIIMTTVLTVLMTVIPLPDHRIIKDTLTGCIVGGVLAGIGVGMFLYAGYSAGGQDVISLYFSKIKPGMTVGTMNIIINIFVFGICLALYDLETVVYSLIFVMVSGIALDRVHQQNINIWLMIFTKVDGIDEVLMKTGRGVTSWEGIGSYTKQKTHIHSMMVNKYELAHMISAIKQMDPKAFIIKTEGPQVTGNFEKRL